MDALAELQERRAHECRLTPDRALETLEDAEDFLADRGLLTRATDSALPSLFEACHEPAYAPGSAGFGQWPATKFVWFGQLGAKGYPILNIHRGKNLMVTDQVARLIDPICRAEIRRMEEMDPSWARLLRQLADAGPSELDDLQRELGLSPKDLKKIRSPLERCGAIVAHSIVYEDPHRHTSELSRWDQVHPTDLRAPVGTEEVRASLADLLVAATRAAVVAPERELRRWFSWQWYWEDSLVEDLVAQGRLQRVDGHVSVPDEQ
ncbi:MAG TPA: hypothetical protein VHV50_04415 [Actinomycetota bacterium]|nr:hypothetical protein [Actinomycetota bacterium]